jgi:hypothetical protein
MAFDTKITLVTDDGVMRDLKRAAAVRGETMSRIVETALRVHLTARAQTPELPELPVFRSGGHLTDVSDREALRGAMEHA